MSDLPWPWQWDTNPQGWYLDGDRTVYGPLPAHVRVNPAPHPHLGLRGFLPRAVLPAPVRAPFAAEAARAAPAPAPALPAPTAEQRAAKALLNEAQQAEARRLIDPWREKRH